MTTRTIPQTPAQADTATQNAPGEAAIDRLMADRAKAIEAAADAVAKGRNLPPREADAIAQIACNQMCDLEDAIMERPVATLADLAAKATIVGSRCPGKGLEWTDEHICQLIKDVTAFAARNGSEVQS